MTKNLFRALATRSTGPLFRTPPAVAAAGLFRPLPDRPADPPEADPPRPADPPLFRSPPADGATPRVLFLKNTDVTPQGTPAKPGSFHQLGGGKTR